MHLIIKKQRISLFVQSRAIKSYKAYKSSFIEFIKNVKMKGDKEIYLLFYGIFIVTI